MLNPSAPVEVQVHNGGDNSHQYQQEYIYGKALLHSVYIDACRGQFVAPGMQIM